MTRRGIFAGLAAIFGSTLLAAKNASANSTNWTVPEGVNVIRVRSFRNGRLVMDTNVDVTPGQLFKIDVVK